MRASGARGPLARDGCRAKVRECLGTVLAPESVDRVIALTGRIETLDSNVEIVSAP